MITGSVPDSAYSFHFRLPSKVHSAIKSIRQFHHLPLSVIFFKAYSSFSSVLLLLISSYAKILSLSICFFKKFRNILLSISAITLIYRIIFHTSIRSSSHNNSLPNLCMHRLFHSHPSFLPAYKDPCHIREHHSVRYRLLPYLLQELHLLLAE